jgi:signal peptidase I
VDHHSNFTDQTKTTEKVKVNKGIINKVLYLLTDHLNNTNLSDKQKKGFIATADIALNLVVIVVLVVLIRSFLISPFQVYGSSMCDTLNFINGKCETAYGEFIIVNKSSYLHLMGFEAGKPQRGDIIVFHPPQNKDQFYIKRVIGLPGETVKLEDGDIYIYNEKNPLGVKLNEPYLNSINQGNTNPMDQANTTTFVVPEGEYFVLGDNRKGSSDSRVCFQESYAGPRCGDPGITHYLDIEHMEGKAALVLWPQPRVIETAQYPELK